MVSEKRRKRAFCVNHAIDYFYLCVFGIPKNEWLIYAYNKPPIHISAIWYDMCTKFAWLKSIAGC